MRRTSLSLFSILITFGVIMLTMTACSAANYETNVYEINESFYDIAIKTGTADIAFLPSDDGMCRVVCYEKSKESHSVEVQNGTLTVNVSNDKKWYDYIGVNIDSPKITIYLPNAEYSSLVIEEDTGDIEIAKNFGFKNIDLSLYTGNVKCYASAAETIKIVASTGDIYVESISASSLNLKTSTGDITACGITSDGNITIDVSTGKSYLSDITCKNLTSTGNTGDISLTNVVATDKISIKRSTGDLTLEGSDAAELYIITDTGNVKGSLLTDKIFITKSNTGRINVPNSITGGRCEISTNTGNINISISAD